MLNALIGLSLRNRFVVLLLVGILAAFGVRAAQRLPLDAFPDTTPVQVQVNTNAPELAPEEVERLITFPVEYATGGLKGLEEVRSISKFGLLELSRAPKSAAATSLCRNPASATEAPLSVRPSSSRWSWS